jgi:hypothetical protein
MHCPDPRSQILRAADRTPTGPLRARRITALLSLAFCASAAGGTLASATLVEPLAPGQQSRLSIPMPTGFAADQEVWVAYELIARPAADDGGEVGLEQSFEGVMTPAAALFTTFDADSMQSSESADAGRVLVGRALRRLPAPGKTDALLLVSVERATGIQPLSLKVTVGQGSLPAQWQEKPQDSIAYKVGYIAGLGLFGWLALRIFRRVRS